eukprot:2424353-Prymnesium_polylepis.1
MWPHLRREGVLRLAVGRVEVEEVEGARGHRRVARHRRQVAKVACVPVSYTHLTLPTICSV